jgi:hypothetical protein
MGKNKNDPTSMHVRDIFFGFIHYSAEHVIFVMTYIKIIV